MKQLNGHGPYDRDEVGTPVTGCNEIIVADDRALQQTVGQGGPMVEDPRATNEPSKPAQNCGVVQPTSSPQKISPEVDMLEP